MPRTKATKKKPTTNKMKNGYVKQVEKFLSNADFTEKETLKNYEEQFNIIADRVAEILKQIEVGIPVHIGNKTIAEIKCMSEYASLSSFHTSSASSLLGTQKHTTRNKLRRSTSLIDDEGYLTSENSAGASSGDRQSRISKRILQTSRVSRSLSRSQMKKNTTLKTPKHNPPPTSFGTITPKIKPNAPQVLLRRPKQGEVALSLQGSPLFTGSVVSESIANVNIPLQNGTMLSIQPQRGLRVSQIPDIDPQIKRQLETLRDNLNKMCALGASKR